MIINNMTFNIRVTLPCNLDYNCLPQDNVICR